MSDGKEGAGSKLGAELVRQVVGEVQEVSMAYKGKIYGRGTPITMPLGHARAAAKAGLFRPNNGNDLEITGV